MTYHDPCYLGRHNGVYDEPREALEADPGLELDEMPESRKDSFCCGGGGGRIWMETPKGERFSDLRLEQAIGVGAEVLVDLLPLLHHQLRGQPAERARRRRDRGQGHHRSHPRSLVGGHPVRGVMTWHTHWNSRSSNTRTRLRQRTLRPDDDLLGDVMVVGGGISGIQAALDLATSGFKVYLVEKTPTIGGKMAQLDKTFPTNDCSMCIESPKFIECDRHPNIEILTYTEVDSVEGEAGRLHRHADEEAALHRRGQVHGLHGRASSTARSRFPTRSTRTCRCNKAVHIYFSQAVPLVTYIDDTCLYLKDKKCSICDRRVQERRHRLQPEGREGRGQGRRDRAVARATRPSTPRCAATTATARYENVVTSLDFERLLCATGPHEGEILRPSDKQHPHKIAWIHCVGSRQVTPGGNSYCSAVCCSYTQKQVILAKDHDCRDAGHDLPQRHPLLRQGLRALLPARGEAARRAVHPQLRLGRPARTR